MNIRLLITTVVLIISIQLVNAQNHIFKPKYNVVIDTAQGERMMNQCSRSAPRNVVSFWKVTQDDIAKLENNFKKVKSLKSTDCCFEGNRISSLDGYGFQYVGVIINNRKFIYVNAFLIHSKNDFETFYMDWQKTPVIVCDGGKSFWGVLFDVEKESFSNLSVNGVS